MWALRGCLAVKFSSYNIFLSYYIYNHTISNQYCVYDSSRIKYMEIYYNLFTRENYLYYYSPHCHKGTCRAAVKIVPLLFLETSKSSLNCRPYLTSELKYYT